MCWRIRPKREAENLQLKIIMLVFMEDLVRPDSVYHVGIGRAGDCGLGVKPEIFS